MLKKCVWCGMLFETSDGRIKRCPKCYESPTPHTAKKTNTTKKSRRIPTIQEVMHIASVYDLIKGTKILNHYGIMTNIIENSKPGTCLCCGSEIPKRLYVCSECESNYNKHKRC